MSMLFKLSKFQNIQQNGFTLIELVIYMAVFIIFGFILIQSTIYLSTHLIRSERDEFALLNDLRKLNLSIEYYGLGLKNERLEEEYGEFMLRPTYATSSVSYGILQVGDGGANTGAMGVSANRLEKTSLNFASTVPLLIQLK